MPGDASPEPEEPGANAAAPAPAPGAPAPRPGGAPAGAGRQPPAAAEGKEAEAEAEAEAAAPGSGPGAPAAAPAAARAAPGEDKTTAGPRRRGRGPRPAAGVPSRAPPPHPPCPAGARAGRPPSLTLDGNLDTTTSTRPGGSPEEVGPEGRLQQALAQASVKLFIGGITGTTTESMLFGHFGKYGEIVEAPVMQDKITKKPRGFAFVVFTKAASVEAALADAHEIDGRAVDVKRAVPRDEYGRPILSEVPTKKIFVGGLASTCTDADLISHFGEYGKIEDAVVMFDGASRRSRGFGFVTFSSESAVDRVLAKGSRQELHKKQVEIKKAIPKETIGGGATRTPSGRGPGARGTRARASGSRRTSRPTRPTSPWAWCRRAWPSRRGPGWGPCRRAWCQQAWRRCRTTPRASPRRVPRTACTGRRTCTPGGCPPCRSRPSCPRSCRS